MSHLVPWPGIQPRPPALGTWSQPLDHQGSPPRIPLSPGLGVCGRDLLAQGGARWLKTGLWSPARPSLENLSTVSRDLGPLTLLYDSEFRKWGMTAPLGKVFMQDRNNMQEGLLTPSTLGRGWVLCVVLPRVFEKVVALWVSRKLPAALPVSEFLCVCVFFFFCARGGGGVELSGNSHQFPAD